MIDSHLAWFGRGLIVGFAISMPVFGPVGSLCVRRTLSRGRLTGFISGFGAATADVLYAGLAAFGLSAISSALLAHRPLLTVGAGIALVTLGGAALRTSASPPTHGPQARGMLGAFASTMLLELSNPATIVLFGAIFTSIGLVRDATSINSAALTAGVFLGCTAWWLVLSSTLERVRTRLTPVILRRTNVAFAIILLAFGVYAMVSGTFMMG